MENVWRKANVKDLEGIRFYDVRKKDGVYTKIIANTYVFPGNFLSRDWPRNTSLYRDVNNENFRNSVSTIKDIDRVKILVDIIAEP